MRSINGPKPVKIIPKVTKGQLAILKCLQNGALLTRNKIAERANLAGPTLCTLLGSDNPEKRDAAEKRWANRDGKLTTRSLVTLGMVTIIKLDIDGLSETVYQITSKGLEYLVTTT